MRAALSLARRGLGAVWPNPAVGCLLVKDGIVVSRGWTRAGGRPHAETVALDQAGAAAAGATAYVSLEPCAHHGQTPPCASALAAARVARVVIAAPDPDPRVDGRGAAILKAAGIAVSEGVCRAEAEALNAGFLMRVRHGRPLVTL
ncbi:MAG TPA: bifunctional diaminohydroxyphosphoribosylaminopyrimidine deaminase/5-amino-6-(5-phosphoribosylamino)uracil reductase RibD, partial [Alphaproteobacteria bacterium]|nr:bifunctional diaminohydroxyphosphoribosylaminopyrimidine deaminase/5-amino-6-(5-phosphoribosylamino)uracil reductase RibD [Alphaproteobacteria bacterium]